MSRHSRVIILRLSLRSSIIAAAAAEVMAAVVVAAAGFDPLMSEVSGFERVIALLEDACEGLLDELTRA